MTLIVALACKNGVVLASDGSAAGFAREFKRAFFVSALSCKINPLGKNILWGASGSVDIIQTIEAEFEELPSAMKDKSLHDLALRKRIKDIHRRCVTNAIKHQREMGVKNEQLIGAELLLVSNDVNQADPIKIWYIGSLRNYFVEDDGCSVIGDGTFYAQMSLLSFRLNLTSLKPRSKNLSTEQGCLVAHRAVKDAIEAGCGIVGPPIDIWVIKDKEKPKMLTVNEKEKLDKAYVAWQEEEVSLLQKLIP